MIFLALILGVIVAKIFGNLELNKMEIKYAGLLFLSVGIDVLLTILTTHDFGKLTWVFIKYYSFFHILYLTILGMTLIFNFQNKGLVLIGTGFIMNVIPIILNGKMPVKYEYLSKIPQQRTDIILNFRSLSHGVFENPKAYFLSDIIYLPIPYKTIISVGDIVIAFGLFLAIIIQAGVVFKQEI
ncbi:DUF5317 domain-containing protein [Peptoniphilus asaccharolyticus]